jgi:Tfp pilus assembly protein PilW
MKSRKRRGATLVELMVGTGLSAIVLTGSLATLYAGSKTWVRGQGQIEVDLAGSQAMRRLSVELREAMAVSVASDGLSLTYRTMRRNPDGSFKSPPEWDGVSRRARVVSTSGSKFKVEIGVAGQETGLTSQLILIDPLDANRSYKVFQAGAGTITRQLTIQLVTRVDGPEGEPLYYRTREAIYLRNIPMITQ